MRTLGETGTELLKELVARFIAGLIAYSNIQPRKPFAVPKSLANAN